MTKRDELVSKMLEVNALSVIIFDTQKKMRGLQLEIEKLVQEIEKESEVEDESTNGETE